ncbi:hypothetical protein FH972_004540 [Carpinus fangiana]|uniref:Cytochrome P450 n=1 Tax=Carpinus fangiana TaxID=176857 RepID=A0A5N6QNY3_9ROSI|nr:hypothetical protein FH972_004540 [Carpinus fangiana]
MELQVLSFPILFSFLLFMFTVLNILKKSFKTHHSSSLPPGPWKLPIFGNMHNFSSGSPPHRALSDLAKKHGPLMLLRLGEVSTIVVSSAEYAKEALKTHDAIFASRPRVLISEILSYDCSSIGFSPLGDYWRQLRKICVLELLSPKRVESYRSLREEELSNFIDWIRIAAKAGSPVNLSSKVFSLVYGITSRSAFGKKCQDQEKFIQIVKDIIVFASGFNIGDFFPSIKLLHVISGVRPELEKMHKEADRIMERIISDHMAKATTAKAGEAATEEDLIDVLLKFHDEHGDTEFSLTKNNIKAVILIEISMLPIGGEGITL